MSGRFNMAASGSHPMVFVLNSDEAVGISYEQILASVGYRVVTFGGRCAELDALRKVGPDAVIVDLRHQYDDRLELLHKIRQGGQQVAIVVIAASPTVRSAVDTLKAGADEILVDPFSSDELKLAVATALRQRREGLS